MKLKIITLTTFLLLTINFCFSQKDTVREQKWALGTTFGYTTVVTPFNRNNFQLTLNLRYKMGPCILGLQPGVNFNYETKLPDLRIGFRLQYDFLKW